MSAKAQPFEPISVLAAVARAECHQGESVPWWLIVEHLGLKSSAATTRRLRPQLHALMETGALRCSRLRGRDVWELTTRGRRRLANAKRRGGPLTLPESPQHREWRIARARAAEEITTLRDQFADVVDHARALLASEEATARVWAGLAGCLHTRCAQLAAATYSLYEWPEPEDVRADLGRQRGLDLTKASKTRLTAHVSMDQRCSATFNAGRPEFGNGVAPT